MNFRAQLIPNNQPNIMLGFIQAKTKQEALNKVCKKAKLSRRDSILIERATALMLGYRLWLREQKLMKRKFKTCLQCPKHEIIPDPDPDDWFCDDDVAVVCTLTANPNQKLASRYKSERNPFRAITCSCRPYQVKRDIKGTPDWCPLKKKP